MQPRDQFSLNKLERMSKRLTSTEQFEYGIQFTTIYVSW